MAGFWGQLLFGERSDESIRHEEEAKEKKLNNDYAKADREQETLVRNTRATPDWLYTKMLKEEGGITVPDGKGGKCVVSAKEYDRVQQMRQDAINERFKGLPPMHSLYRGSGLNSY